VLWKVTPSCAEWLASHDNVFFTTGVLNASSFVLELGCGISPLNALAASPRVARYILTDQPYVQKLIQRNIDENPSTRTSSSTRHSKPKKAVAIPARQSPSSGNIQFKILDWETDQVTHDLTGDAAVRSFDAVLACDCVFNYALIDPFVQTCVDLCRLRQVDATDETEQPPCLCIVAQQLRNDDVFQSWLTAFSNSFHVWRLPDDILPERLRPDAGFVVHVGVLR
jgi:predicted nicotinamide N-methyase